MLTIDQHELLRTAASAVYKGHLTSKLSETASTVEELAINILASVRLSLVALLREHNRKESLSPQHQLPLELWGVVWAHLSPRDCITVSHVSHDWRRAALGCPNLWTAPTYVAAEHETGCDCRACADRRAGRACHTCGKFGTAMQVDLTAQTQSFLERSGGLSLDLNVHVHSRASVDSASTFAATVQPHVERLRTMKVVVAEVRRLVKFLQPFDGFPELHELVVDYTSDDMEDLELERPLELPKLQKLSLKGLLSIGETGENALKCANVVSLRASFIHIGQVKSLLQVCPAVKDLDLEVGSSTVTHPDEDTSVADLRERLTACGINSLRIFKVYDVDVTQILAMFHLAPIPRFVIVMYRSTDVNTNCLRKFFQPMVNPMRLECVPAPPDNATDGEQGRVAVYADDATMSERALTLRLDMEIESCKTLMSSLFGTILNSSAANSITHIRIGAKYWARILSWQGTLAVTTAVIEFNGDGETVDDWFEAATGPLSLMPHLQHAEICAVGENLTVKLSPSLARAIAMVFGLSGVRKLETLHFNSVKVQGLEIELQSVTEAVRVTT